MCHLLARKIKTPHSSFFTIKQTSDTSCHTQKQPRGRASSSAKLTLPARLQPVRYARLNTCRTHFYETDMQEHFRRPSHSAEFDGKDERRFLLASGGGLADDATLCPEKP